MRCALACDIITQSSLWTLNPNYSYWKTWNGKFRVPQLPLTSRAMQFPFQFNSRNCMWRWRKGEGGGGQDTIMEVPASNEAIDYSRDSASVNLEPWNRSLSLSILQAVCMMWLWTLSWIGWLWGPQQQEQSIGFDYGLTPSLRLQRCSSGHSWGQWEMHEREHEWEIRSFFAYRAPTMLSFAIDSGS